MSTNEDIRITLIGVGTIGLSFAAFHLTHLASPAQLTIFDTRPDLESYVKNLLPTFYASPDEHHALFRLKITNDLKKAVKNATIIQESGPENLPFKQALWSEVESYAPADALLWSSTSGIPASQQSQNMRDKSRLLVVHPYNPPHIMPLLELVPSPQTSPSVISRTQQFWEGRGRVPILVKKEVTGFVSNRLAFALLREAIHLVNEGVVTVKEVDEIVTSSMGPRWAVAGPFKSYHAGGGEAGLEGFFGNIGGTVQGCWEDSEQVNVGDGWEERIFREAKEAYGAVDTGERNRATRRVLEVVGEEKEREGRLKEAVPGPASDPVIRLLAERAKNDEELKGVMKSVASGLATPGELQTFQEHISELKKEEEEGNLGKRKRGEDQA